MRYLFITGARGSGLPASPLTGGPEADCPSEKGGFTLVELMVAVTVLSMMILFLFSVFNQTTQAWQASEKKADAFREARAALFVIKRDLAGIQVEEEMPLALNQNLVPNLTSPSVPTDQLFFVSALSPDIQGGNNRGDLCAVGYYVGWSTNSFQTNNNDFANKSYNLFRFFRSAGTNFYNLTNFWNGFTPPGNLATLYKDPSTYPISGDEVLARNVIGFRVRPYYWHGTVTVVGGVTNTNYVLTSTNTGSSAASVIFTNRPAFLDISMTVLNYATAGQLGNNSLSWNQQISDTNGNNAVQKNKQEFSTKIPLDP